jgi:riboflavin synthase
MFSGIVEEIGSVILVEDSQDGRRLTIEAPLIGGELAIGDSVSVSGCCLTVVSRLDQCFTVEAVHETLTRTKLGSLTKGSKVNLEPALRFNDRLGGHLVSGHIDAVASVKSITQEGFASRVSFEMDNQWAPYFIEKGSVAVDGVSLTVAEVDPMPGADNLENPLATGFSFAVVLIPHTLSVTTFSMLKVGERVNIETDLVAKYLARWFGADQVKSPQRDRVALLEKNLFGLNAGFSQNQRPSGSP